MPYLSALEVFTARRYTNPRLPYLTFTLAGPLCITDAVTSSSEICVIVDCAQLSRQ